MKRLSCTLAFSILLLPAASFAASKEQQEMQRDIAQLQDQVRTIQSTLDQRLASMQTLMEQSLEANNRNGKDVSALAAGVKDTLDRELRDALRPIAGLTAKVDNLNNSSSEVQNSLTDLNAQMNRVLQKLTDIDNAIKVLQAPAPPPPSTNPDSGVAQTGGARPGAVPPAGVLWGNANNDYSSGKYDLAVGEFTDFVRDYPDDPFAPKAMVYLGQIHLSQMKYDLAVMDFDAVLERYPENKDSTPDAYFMKGMALKYLGRKTDAAEQFRSVIRKFPKSDRKPEAEEALRELKLPGAPATAARKKKS